MGKFILGNSYPPPPIFLMELFSFHGVIQISHTLKGGMAILEQKFSKIKFSIIKIVKQINIIYYNNYIKQKKLNLISLNILTEE